MTFICAICGRQWPQLRQLVACYEGGKMVNRTVARLREQAEDALAVGDIEAWRRHTDNADRMEAGRERLEEGDRQIAADWAAVLVERGKA